MTPEWIWLVFLFALGACIGSFLNVVIYRLPREKSLITPPSACPGCGKNIRFYDNIPLFSWLILGGKCRYCKCAISSRYFVVELLTAFLFIAVYLVYFVFDLRRTGLPGETPMSKFFSGGWLFYLNVMVLVAAFLAASAIDLELWVIPISICWFVTAVGVLCAGLGIYLIDPNIIWTFKLFPRASEETGALALGAAVGLAIAMILLVTGLIKRSYEFDDPEKEDLEAEEPEYNHRLEVMKEMLFLLPIIAGSLIALWILVNSRWCDQWWGDFSQKPVVTGVLGSIWGYFIGGAVVWATRIFGTLAFGKEAMGLGDVHLMAAAGAVIGPVLVVIAFFVAPFFGLAWAGYQMFFQKTRQIPYGPFLSLGVFGVMIFHDWIQAYLAMVFTVR